MIDSSVMLAALFREDGAAAATEAMREGVISAVNLAEAATVLRRRGLGEAATRETLAAIADRVIAFDHDQAIDAGLLDSATKDAGLSLGDRACLTLARLLRAEAVTADRAWGRVADAASVTVRLIR